MKVPTYLDAALEEAEVEADAAYRDWRTKAWLEMRLGPGPWGESDRRRELDALGLLVRAQAAAGVRTWLERPPRAEPERPVRREPSLLCNECSGPMPTDLSPKARYCQRTCSTRAANRRWRERQRLKEIDA